MALALNVNLISQFSIYCIKREKERERERGRESKLILGNKKAEEWIEREREREREIEHKKPKDLSAY